MRIALVGAEIEENLSIRYLASCARAAGFETKILPYSNATQLPIVSQYIAFHQPELVGFSIAFQHRAREFLALAKRVRSDGFTGHLTVGGHFPTFSYREILENHAAIDTVVRHEAEQTLVELARMLDHPERWPEIPGIACRGRGGAVVVAPPRPVCDELDTLPFPVRAEQLPEHAGLPFATIVGSRGCFANCNYCCINTYHRARPGKRYRERSAENIADEVALLWHERDARIFCFHDEDLFLPKPQRTRERLDAIRTALDARDVGLLATVGKCRPDCVDGELLQWARERFGLIRIYLGIENGSQHGLDTLGRGVSIETCHNALHVLREVGTYSCFNLLLFDPHTRMEDLDDNIAFMREFADFPFNFCRTEIYAGTHFEKTLRQEGRLFGSYLGYGYRIPDERVELMFRAMAVAFSMRNFAPDGLCNRLSMAGYEAALVDMFEPSKTATAAENAIRDITRRSNLHAVDTMQRIREFVSSPAGVGDHEAAQRFAVDLALDVNQVSFDLGVELSKQRDRLANAAAAAA